jgi:tetratricopeptide (TPR) repeat protein/predicted phosphodiesterase
MAVSWLHISDLHIKTGDPYDRNVVLHALINAVKWYRENGHPVDLIFFTGDIAHSGLAAEYEIATRFFDELLAAAGIPKNRLYLIPGNHDVDRSKSRALARTLASREDADEYFEPGSPILHLTIKQASFLAWHDQYFTGIRQWPQHSTCGPLDSIEINNQPFAILPLNSALFCLDDYDHNKLFLGRRPLQPALEQIAKLPNALKIALIHHPLDWLSDIERPNIEAALCDSFDVILRGHLHENEAEPPVFAAGAAYQSRKWPNRALFASFDNGRLTIFPIRYEDSPREVWTDDVSLYPREPGHQKTFPLARFRQTPAPLHPNAAARPAPSRPIPTNIPPRFSPFVGREDYLDKIAAQLGAPSTENALVLHGHSGVGKSELAREFARRHRAAYPGGAFLLNASVAILPTDLARLGQTHLGLRFEPDLPIPYQAERTLAALGSEPLLLIYDNAESIDSIRAFFPGAGTPCHLLITTVADPWRSGLPTLKIEPFSTPDSIQLIQALGGDEVAKAYGERLAEVAGGLPMQIVPAARMLSHERERGRLSSAQLTLTAEAGQSFRGVYERLDADSQLLLHAALQFNSQRILRDELAAHLKEGAGWQDAQFTRSLDLCFDLHLLDGTSDLRMHQLFAAFLRESILPSELSEPLRAIRTVQARRFVHYARQIGDKPTDVEAVSKLLAFPVDFPSWQEYPLTSNDTQWLGFALYELRRFDEARPWFDRAAELAEIPDSEGRIDHESLGRSLHQIGSCLLQTENYAEAKTLFERALTEKREGDLSGRLDHESLGASLHQVGYCLSQMGQYAEAQPWLERALAESEQGDLKGRVDHESLGKPLHQIGTCLAAIQQYVEAKPRFERAVAEKNQGDLLGRIDHESIARSLDWLARCHVITGNLEQALSAFKRAVAESRQGDVHGRVDNKSLAISLRNTAFLLRELDRIPEAEACEREANQLDPQS